MRMAVLGAGSWGTALARLLGWRDHRVTLWTHSAEQARELITERKSLRYLPEVELPANVHPTHEMAEALSEAERIILALPSRVVREVCQRARGLLPPETPVVSGAKGLEVESCLRMSEVIAQVLGASRPIAVISGPSFASEVARGCFSAVVVASRNQELARDLQSSFSTEWFRIYTSDDVIGVEMGGALKNVIAMAAGCADGLGVGANARAALITRGLAEIARLTERMGGDPRTLAGLAGLGDLVLTCTEDLSRNRRVGMALGRGQRLEEILASLGQVAEAVYTVRSARDLSAALQVDMPITAQVYQVLYQAKSPRQAVLDLMARELKPELG